MARTPLTRTSLNRVAGIAPTAYANSDNTNGNSIANDGHTWLEASNTDAGTQTLTIHLTQNVDGQVPAAKVYSMTAGTFLKIGPFPTGDYSGTLQVNTSAATLKLAAYRLPNVTG